MPGDPELWTRGHAEAASHGLGAALTLLHGVLGPGTLAGGISGHAVAPLEVARTAHRVWTGERYVDLPSHRRQEAGPVVLDGSGLTTLRWEPRQPDERPGTPAARDWERGWGTALAWVRLGHSRRLFGLATAHLGQRTSAGSPLLRRQLVQGSVADAVVEHLEIESALTAAGSAALTGAGLGHWHDRLTAVDRLLLRLLGAGGYTAAGPGRAAYASELLSDVYVRPRDGHAAVGGEL
ncbi:hypothetical protein ACF073_06790 [Streptomyces sp. NPDC015171]|uniref:hypothetical protein n=1 Tax=Streptomyces sp. NPDC015171 TaxID=3364945 RepID=UPI0036FEBD7B